MSATTVKHAHHSAIADDGSDVGSNAWNADHSLTAAPINAVQFADSLSSLAGDADFTWVSGLGLTIGGVAGVASGETYNITSTNTSFITPSFAGTGGNLFQGHMAVGNYADIDFAVYNPGDPTLVTPQAISAVFLVDEYQTGDLSANPNNSNFATVGGYRHIGASAAAVNGLYQNVAINTNSTGPFDGVAALALNFGNFGSGHINNFFGVSAFTDNEGSGTVDQSVALSAFQYVLVTNTITDLIGVKSDVQHDGGTVTNAYGLKIEDWSGIGSTASYNILSAGTSFITPSDTSGGNLFQGRVGIGNYADVGGFTLNPGDPVNNIPIYGTGVAVVLNEYFSGDLTITGPGSLVVWPGFKHTGAAQFFTNAMDFEPTINSDSTGPIGDFLSFYLVPTNYGSGNVANIWGLLVTPVHAGSGTLGSCIGFQGQLTLAGGLTTNAYNFLASSTSSSGGGVTNNYGFYCADQSGIGSSISENIHSAGASSLTKFEGHHYQGNYYETTEVTAPSAPPANGVRIYAQDNGGGKTQLMALFNTGAAQQIAIQP